MGHRGFVVSCLDRPVDVTDGIFHREQEGEIGTVRGGIDTVGEQVDSVVVSNELIGIPVAPITVLMSGDTEALFKVPYKVPLSTMRLVNLIRYRSRVAVMPCVGRRTKPTL